MLFRQSFVMLNNRKLRWRPIVLLCVVVSIAVVGTMVLLTTRAANTTANIEPELGAIAGNAAQVGDVAASGGKALKFGAGVVAPRSCNSKPDATCTGVPAGTALTVVNGDLTVSADGAIVDAKDVRGLLIIQASNVTVRNSIIRGRTVSTNGAYITIKSGSNIRIEDSEIAPITPSVYLDGIWGQNFSATRLHIRGGVDGMKISDNSRIESSFIYNMNYFASDPNQGGGETHNDGIQILEGQNIQITGNNIPLTSAANAAIQITQDYGVVSSVAITGNWFDGGGCTVNIAHKVMSALSGVTLQNNRFGRNSYWNCPILLSTKATVGLANNVWEDNGQAVPVQVHD